jgi:hypothetical protein
LNINVPATIAKDQRPKTEDPRPSAKKRERKPWRTDGNVI